MKIDCQLYKRDGIFNFRLFYGLRWDLFLAVFRSFFLLYFSVYLVPVGRPRERGHTWGWSGRGQLGHSGEMRGGEGGPGGPGHPHQGDHLPEQQVSLAAFPHNLGVHPLQPGRLLHQPRLRPPGLPADHLPSPATREVWGQQTFQLHRDIHQV